MILLDTHAWIWWTQQDSRLSAPARTVIENEMHVGVSPISCWEVSMLAAKGRVDLAGTVEQWTQGALDGPGILLLPLTPSAAVLAGGPLVGLHGDPADRLIAATAIELCISL